MNQADLRGQPAPFVGRNRELVEIAQLLTSSDCRLLSLIGPGGIGKTRLAIQAGLTNAQYFSQNVHFVPLAPIDAPDLLISTVAEHFGIQFESHEEPRLQLLQYLHEKSMLLVMDNFEHLLEGTELLVDILREAPYIRILVTSRERLSLVEEHVFEVRGLYYPEQGVTDNLQVYDAVQLFLGHAQRAIVGFTPGESDLQAIAHTCRLVEGMPLAIELAAAWVRSLSCDEIAREIEQSLNLLSTTLRNMPERHRSIRAAFAHSWERLDETERAVFQKLSVFRGSFHREAAAQVANATIHTLSRLIDRSLLRTTTSGQYELHELLRQFAEEQLAASPDEEEATRDLHSMYYAEFLHQRALSFFFGRVKEAVNDVEQEMGNFRAAWHRSIRRGNLDNLIRSADSLWVFHEIKSRYQEGETIFSRAVEAVKNQPEGRQQQITLGKLLSLQGFFLIRLGHYDRARELLQTSYQILSEFGMSQELADTRVLMAFNAFYQGDYENALFDFQDSLEMNKELGVLQRIGWTLYGLSRTSHALGHYEQAAQQAREVIRIGREIGAAMQLVDCLIIYGQIMKKLKHYDEAASSIHEAHRLASELGNPQRAAWALLVLGETYLAQANYEQARNFLHRALQSAIEIPFLRLQLAVLVEIAELLLHDGEIAHAKELLIITFNHPSGENETRERAGLLLNELQHEWQPSIPPGSVKTLNQAIAAIYRLPQFARLEVAASALEHAGRGSSTSEWVQAMADPLTPREMDVLLLAAEGLSNQEIADHMIVALSTVKKHINHIYSKLGVKNRTQAIKRAHELKIL